jgi:integrase
MTATYQKNGNRPNYYVVLHYKDDATGKNRTKWVSTDIPVKGNNKRLADVRAKEVLADYQQQRLDLSKDVLFTVFITEWLEHLKPSIELATYDTYRIIIQNQIIPFYEPKKLKVREITPLHIQQYVKYKLKTASPNTVIKHLWNLQKCLDSAVKQRLISFNPVKMIDKPKKIKYTGAQYYTEKQIDELLQVFKGDKLEGIILFAVFYGLRRSEIMGLKWDAVNFNDNTFTVQHTVVQTANKIYHNDSTKTKSSYRTLPMSVIIVDMLNKIKSEQDYYKRLQPNDYVDDGYIFTQEEGRLINPNYVTKHFKDVLAKNGLTVLRLHDLRHSSASYLLSLGFDIKTISTWLGHGDVGTTANLYLHKSMDEKRNVAGILNDKFQKFGT